METSKYNREILQEGSNGKSLSQLLPLTYIKEIAQGLSRTVRWSKYCDPNLMKYYLNNLVNKTFPTFKDITAEKFKNNTALMNKYDTIWKGMLHPKRKNHEDETHRLKGTMKRGGNTRDHTRIARRETKKYTQIDQEKGKLTQEEYEIIDMVKILHDVAEFIFGDVISYIKKEDEKRMEYSIGKVIIDDIIQKLQNDDLFKQEAKNYLLYVRDIAFIKFAHPMDVQDKQMEKLAVYFRLNEVYDFFLDAIFVSKNPTHIKDLSHSDRLEKHNAGALVHSVLKYQIKELWELIDKFKEHKTLYPSIKAFLKEHEQEIDALFAFVESSRFLQETSSKDTLSLQDKRIHHESAKSLWEKEFKPFITPPPKPKGKKSTNLLPASTVAE